MKLLKKMETRDPGKPFAFTVPAPRTGVRRRFRQSGSSARSDPEPSAVKEAAKFFLGKLEAFGLKGTVVVREGGVP